MNQNQKWEEQETQFIKIINEFENEYQKNKTCINEKVQAVIFVGGTGSGKSTIVNWLNNADYECEKTEFGYELKLKDEKNYSKIGKGTASITKKPEYHFNEENQCLMIDFPGFKDTRGWEEQLIIKLMFYDILSTIQTKLVVVIEHPSLTLHSRGADLQELVQNTFKDDTATFESICVILNQFTKKDQIKFAIPKFILALDTIEQNSKDITVKKIYKALRKNVYLIESVESPEDLITIFNSENKIHLWNEIKKANSLKIKANEIEHSERISQYLLEKSQFILSQVGDTIKTHLISKIHNFNEGQLKQILELFKKFFETQGQIKVEKFQEVIQYQNLMDFVGKLIVIINQTGKTPNFFEQSFLRILKFFSNFKSMIKGYQNSLANYSIWLDICYQHSQMVEDKIIFLQKYAEAERKCQNVSDRNDQLRSKNSQIQFDLQQSKNMFNQKQNELSQQLTDIENSKEEVIQQLLSQKKLTDQSTNEKEQLHKQIQTLKTALIHENLQKNILFAEGLALKTLLSKYMEIIEVLEGKLKRKKQKISKFKEKINEFNQQSFFIKPFKQL